MTKSVGFIRASVASRMSLRLLGALFLLNCLLVVASLYSSPAETLLAVGSLPLDPQERARYAALAVVCLAFGLGFACILGTRTNSPENDSGDRLYLATDPLPRRLRCLCVRAASTLFMALAVCGIPATAVLTIWGVRPQSGLVFRYGPAMEPANISSSTGWILLYVLVLAACSWAFGLLASALFMERSAVFVWVALTVGTDVALRGSKFASYFPGDYWLRWVGVGLEGRWSRHASRGVYYLALGALAMATAAALVECVPRLVANLERKVFR